MNARDGSNVVRLTFSDYNPAGAGGQTANNLSGFDLNPHWSPQGDRIVFHSGRDISFGAAQWDAFSIDSTIGENPGGGTPARQLTKRDFNDERCGWGVATPHNAAVRDEGRSRHGHRDELAAGHRLRRGLRQWLRPGHHGHAHGRPGGERIDVHRLHRWRL